MSAVIAPLTDQQISRMRTLHRQNLSVSQIADRMRLHYSHVESAMIQLDHEQEQRQSQRRRALIEAQDNAFIAAFRRSATPLQEQRS